MLIRTRLRRVDGFSMIELMIAVSILLVLLLRAVPGMSAWVNNNQIRNAAMSVQNGLQYARGQAVVRNAQVQFNLTSSGDWTVTSGASTLQSRANTDTPNAVVSSTMTVTFNGLGRLTLGTGTPTVDITNTTGGNCVANGGPMQCLRVVVQPGGQTRICNPNPNLPTTDPQAC